MVIGMELTTNSKIQFKASILKLSLCDANILLKGTISVTNTGTAAARNNNYKGVVFKNCASFTDCTSEINNHK